MKNKILTVFMLITTTLALTACTQADSDNSTADNSSTTLQSGSVAAENLAGGAMISGDGPITGISDIDNKTSAVIEAQPEIQHGSGFGGVGITEAIQNEENYADDEPDAVDEDETGETDEDEGWSGLYVCSSGEKLTVTIDEADYIQFEFETAGISGKAELDGNQAVYHGDDYHVVVFDRNGDEIEVSVLSEEDYDTSESPLMGTYIRK